MLEAVLFGLLALIFTVYAIAQLVSQKPLSAAVAGLKTLFVVGLTAYFWWRALGAGGKSQNLFGFDRYPGILIIGAAIAIAGLFCSVVGFVQYSKKK